MLRDDPHCKVTDSRVHLRGLVPARKVHLPRDPAMIMKKGAKSEQPAAGAAFRPARQQMILAVVSCMRMEFKMFSAGR